jgi:hypothetical protein
MNEKHETSHETPSTEPTKAPYHAPETLDLGDAIAKTKGGSSGARRDFFFFNFRT